MSLVTQINNALTRVGTEFKAVYGQIGSLPSLATTNKASLVGAINEVNGAIGGAGASIDDVTARTSTVYSSSKTETLVATKPSINDTVASGTAVYSSTKTNSQITAAVADRPIISDTGPSTTAVYSSTKVAAEIQASKDAILGGAGAAYDTLGELQALMQADDTETTGILTALGLRVRVDAAQAFSSPQKQQARDNIDVYSRAELGDPATDFVAVFNAALV